MSAHDPAELLHAINHDLGAGDSDVLARHCRDLVRAAAAGQFDTLATRPELEELRIALRRKHKGSCVLLGREGVGKTALVETLVREVVVGRMPELEGVRFFELLVPSLVEGGRYRGDVEGRLAKVLTELRKLECEVVVFVDEMHTLLDAGAAENVPGIGQALKAALGRGELRLIAATTRAEYRTQVLDRDPAFARRFHEVEVAEPEGELLRQMVLAQAAKLARAHRVRISEVCAVQAIVLTDEHVGQRTQPDKAVDLLDLAAARASIAAESTLQAQHLLDAVQRWTDRPVHDSVQRVHQLAALEAELGARIAGQRRAVQTVVDTLHVRALGLGDPRRPRASFLFVGDTGVGKTELARGLCHALYGSNKRLCRIDLAEYATLEGLDKLIGAPQSYRGSEHQRGALIEFLEASGQGVILLDEVEKAHPAVHRLLLGLLDEGRITSGRGRTFDARHCILVMTSNAVTSWQAMRAGVGFGAQATQQDLRDKLAASFPREMLGRIDEVVVFDRLDDQALAAVCRLRLQDAAARIKQAHGIELRVSDELVQRVLAKLDSRASGARGIQRLVEREVMLPLAKGLVEQALLV